MIFIIENISSFFLYNNSSIASIPIKTFLHMKSRGPSA